MKKKDKIKKVYKSEALNKGNFQRFNLNDYRVFLLLLSKLKRNKNISSQNFQREYELTAKEFSEAFKIKLRVCYSILKRSVQKLFKSDIFIEKPELKESWVINICSMAKYDDHHGRIKIEFSDRIIPYLIRSSQRYVLYPLLAISNFQSLYSVRLYENLMAFKTTGWMVKSVKELRNILGVGQNLKLYSNFKNRAIVNSCNEINSYHDLGLKFEEIKNSRKVSSIKFSFKKDVCFIKGSIKKINELEKTINQIPSCIEA